MNERHRKAYIRLKLREAKKLMKVARDCPSVNAAYFVVESIQQLVFAAGCLKESDR